MNLPQNIFDFLIQLTLNNNREWFNNNKDTYLQAKSEFERYINYLIQDIHSIDAAVGFPQAKDCIFRIYKDVRFSKDKLPYKNHFGAYIALGGRKSPYAGYYIHIEPDNSFIAGGLHSPQPDQLKLVRTRILEEAINYKTIIEDKNFCKLFDHVIGDKLKTAPKGFDKNNPNIHLIRYKSYTVMMPLSDDLIQSDNLYETILSSFKTMFPFNNFLNKAIK